MGIRGVGGHSRYKSWAAAPRPTDGRSSAMHVRAIREVQARPRDRRGCVGGTRETQRPGWVEGTRRFWATRPAAPTRVEACGVRQAQAALPPSTHDLSGSYRSALLTRTLLHVSSDATAFSAAATGALAVDGVTAWPPAGGQQRSSERQAALPPSTHDLSGSYRSALLTRTLLHVSSDATAFSAAATGALAADGVTAWPPAGGQPRFCERRVSRADPPDPP